MVVCSCPPSLSVQLKVSVRVAYPTFCPSMHDIVSIYVCNTPPCSELIVRYQARARECEQYKGKLASLEQANTGLRAELQALHKV